MKPFSLPGPLRRLVFLAVLMGIGTFSSAVFAGPPKPEEMYSAGYVRKHLIVGKTTMASAESAFGRPSDISRSSQGSGERVTWTYRRAARKEGVLTAIRRKAASAALLTGGAFSNAMSRTSGAAAGAEDKIDSAKVLTGTEDMGHASDPERIEQIRLVFMNGVVSYLSYD